jgi:hypothetical protein
MMKGRYLEAVRRGLFKIVTQHMPEGDERIQVKPQSGEPVFGSSINPGPSELRKRSANCLLWNLISTATAFTSVKGNL